MGGPRTENQIVVTPQSIARLVESGELAAALEARLSPVVATEGPHAADSWNQLSRLTALALIELLFGGVDMETGRALRRALLPPEGRLRAVKPID